MLSEISVNDSFVVRTQKRRKHRIKKKKSIDIWNIQKNVVSLHYKELVGTHTNWIANVIPL